MIDPNVKQYLKVLDKLGIRYQTVEHPEIKTATEVLGYLGLNFDDSAATLVVRAGSQFVVLIRRDDCQLDLEKVKKILNVADFKMATKEEFERLTGLPVGAARPVIPGLKTYIDKKVIDKKYTYGGSGSFTCTIRYKTADLVRIPNSKVVDIIQENAAKRRVFSGSRPTGKLHLGNYLGGLKGYIALQERGYLDCIYSVVDLHGITSPYNPKTFQQQIREVVLDYLGAGLDPKKCHLMIQSQIPEHIELAYLLGTIYPVSRAEQLPTYKDKKKEQPDYVNIGLFYYPILMAADILLYKAELVPVGIDQEPHLEVTREIARKFNRLFGKVFPEPQRFATEGEYIPSLTGEGKMSKSIKDSYILLIEDLKTIKDRLAKAPTDSGKGKIVPKKGGVANLLILVELFMGKKDRQRYEKDYLGKGISYAGLKDELARAVYEELKPIQERRRYFEDHPKEVDQILEQGRVYCSKIAKSTLLEVKKAMGLV